VNLGALIDFVGNLLDYDPTNPTYRTQLVSLLNDAQGRLLTDRPWDFSIRDRVLKTYTDAVYTATFTNGSATVTGTFPSSSSPVLPGSALDRASVTVTDSAGNTFEHLIAWVQNGTTLYLDRPFVGVTGAYAATVKRRDVFLPSDCMTVENVSDPSVGIPAKALFLSKWEREDANLDASLLGTIEAFLPSEGKVVPAPSTVRGVTVQTVPAGQGVRTIDVYMCNVRGPRSTAYRVYREDVSDGFESGLSKIASFALSDTQTLHFQPETIANTTGLYRRYYFACADANILAPVRVRNDDAELPQPPIGTDTVAPTGGVILKPDLSLNTLAGQAFQSTAIRYQYNQSAGYQSFQLYPHPSADQDVNVRMVLHPARLQEDQDAPLVPAAYSQIIAYAALENLTLKVDNPALSAVYARKKDLLYKGMEQRYLKAVPRRIIKGTPTAGYRYVRNPFGKLTFTP